MPRRLAGVVAALLLTACSVPFIGSSAPAYGFITVTADGNPLVGGADNVPPTLDLDLHAQVPFRLQDVTATLDGKSLPVQLENGDITASTKPMPLGSSHHLAVTIAG